VALLVRRVHIDNVWPTDAAAARPGPVDLRIVGDRITDIEPRIAPGARDEEVDGRGGTVLPGLHDHHVHLWAWAAARTSVSVDPADVPTETLLADRLTGAPGAPGSWVRATGYHESVAGDLDRAALDRLVPDRPARVQHRSGALWVLNTRALEALGLLEGAGLQDAPPGVERDRGGAPTGRLWRVDRWLGTRLGGVDGDPSPDLDDLSRRAAEAGITGFTDATPDLDEDGSSGLIEAQRTGALRQRLLLMRPLRSLESGTGQNAIGPDRVSATVSMGAVKVMLDDDRLPSFDEFVGRIRHAHAQGVSVAVHCVTRAQSALTLAAFGEAGAIPGDRMEHGAVLGADLLPALRDLGITVVSQPGFVQSRGDRYLADVDAKDHDDLWRLRSLLDAGIPTAVSSDAPFGPADPWAVARVAGSRRTRGGQVLSPNESIDPRRALALFCGEPARPGSGRQVAEGATADLVVLAVPLDEALVAEVPPVLATVVAGRVTNHDEAL